MFQLFLNLNAEIECTYVRQVYILGSMECSGYSCQWLFLRTSRMLSILAVTTQQLRPLHQIGLNILKIWLQLAFSRFHKVSHPFKVYASPFKFYARKTATLRQCYVIDLGSCWRSFGRLSGRQHFLAREIDLLVPSWNAMHSPIFSTTKQ